MQTIFPKGQQIISQLPHSAGLTPNQKKKRRQKLSKLYKRKQNSAERSQLADVHPAEATPASPTFIAPTDSIAVDTAEGPDRRAEFSHSHGSVCAAPAGAAPDQPLLKRPRRASSQEDAGLATAYNLAAPSESAASADAGAAHREPSGATEPAPLILEGKNGKRVFVYGNYHRYYGYRLGQSFSMDPRLALFERSWFANKRCMDVGCNEGLVTLAIVTRFGSRSMVGVDIDEHLVKKACRQV